MCRSFLSYCRVLLFLSSWHSTCLLAQNVDSIITLQRLKNYHQQALTSIQTKPIEVLRAGLAIRKLANGNAHWQALSQLHIGNYFKRCGKLDVALWYYQYTLNSLTKAVRNDSLQAEALYEKGMTYSLKGWHDSAAVYGLKSQKLFEYLNDDKGITRCLYMLGKIYDSVNDSVNALAYCTVSIEQAKRTKDLRSLALAYDGLGAWQLNHQKPNEALKTYNEVLKLYRSVNSIYDVARCEANIGAVYDELEQTEKSIAHYKMALSGFEQLKSEDNLAWTYVNLGATYFNNGDAKTALLYFDKAELLSREGKLYPQWQAVSEYLSIWHEQAGHFEQALRYQQQFIHWRDSLQGIDKQNYVNALEQKYKSEKKENAIRQLQQESRLKAAESSYYQKQAYWLLVISLLVTLFLLLVFFFYKHRIKTTRLLANQNEELYRKKINELIKTQELKSIEEIMEGQEHERKRIAEDLHDRLGGMLATVKLHFNALEQKIDSMELKHLEQYQKANVLLDSVCDEVRKIAHNMESGVLANFGLIPALDDLKEVLEQAGELKFNSAAYGLKQRLNSNVEIAVYRIIQELVSNAIKHAQASEMNVELTRKANQLVVMVSDNGKGYHPDAVTGGMGLKNIKARVNRLNGTFFIDSGLNNGTTNIIEIPLTHDTYIDS